MKQGFEQIHDNEEIINTLVRTIHASTDVYTISQLLKKAGYIDESYIAHLSRLKKSYCKKYDLSTYYNINNYIDNLDEYSLHEKVTYIYHKLYINALGQYNAYARQGNHKELRKILNTLAYHKKFAIMLNTKILI